ncbi:MAG: PTS sugar transporter subunit IIA [Candidatus Delongbacteria bacterium]|nr:PTS sugar transporter subunit IIA [Candidatus Delongbacteria bacterium]
MDHIKFQILEAGILILAAYLGGYLARKIKIGEVVGQIIGGVVVGPHFLHIIYRFLLKFDGLDEVFLLRPVFHFFENSYDEYAKVMEDFHFFIFLFLGIIAFSIGEELHRDRVRKVGIKATIICVIQAFVTFALIFSGFYFVFDFELIHALIIGSIGIATAPALTFVLMNKLKIEGKLKNLLANIVVLDDIIEVIFFSIFLGIAVALQTGHEVSFTSISILVIEELFFSVLIGFVIFFILKKIVKKKLPEPEEQEFIKDDRTFLSRVLMEHPTPSVEILLIILGIVALGIAVAMHFNLPFLITAIVAGFLISNFHSHALFDSLKIENVMPMFNLLFFAIIGSNVNVESFSGETLIFVGGYLVLRTTGKLAGSWYGCKVTDQDSKITACLPKLMLPQAGMAAVETILVFTVLKNSGGQRIFDTIIPALVVFELGGAWLSEKTLIKWKNWIIGESKLMNKNNIDEIDDNSFIETDEILTLSTLIYNRVFEISAESREAAINILTSKFVEGGIIYDKDIIVNSILEREKLGSTGIGGGVAFPHCRTSAVESVKVVCGLMENPVDWKSPDEKEVDLIFMIITPEKYPEQHLKALKVITTALRDEIFKEELKDALKENSVEKFLKEI